MPRSRSPRGSSARSAGAAGLVPFALGTETWGSITTPCSYGGLAGVRPTELHQRTPLPKAVMTVMAYHSSVLHHAVKANQCDAAAIGTHLARLQSTALLESCASNHPSAWVQRPALPPHHRR